MTSDYVWTPLGASSDELTEFLTLRPGIPTYMREPIIQWVIGGAAKTSGGHFYTTGFLLRFQTVSKTNLSIEGTAINGSNLQALLRAFPDHTLANLVHFVLSEVSVPLHGQNTVRTSSVEDILSSGGSSYTVGLIQGRFGLMDRVPAAVADTVEDVISSAGKASSLLSSAWEQAFGMNKNPSHSYYDAVRAVEVLSVPIFSPNDKLGTLGKDINVLRNDQSGKFTFVMHGGSTEHVLAMMKLLWHSHTDRHGHADYAGVTAEEAQAAVLLASTLIGWFAKGMVTKAA